MRTMINRLAVMACAALIVSTTGCSQKNASSDTDALAQQRKDVMGGPPPAGAQAEIAAARARATQAIQAAQLAAQQRQSKPTPQ